MISRHAVLHVIVNTIAALQMFTRPTRCSSGPATATYANDAALFYVVYLFQQAFEFLHMGYASAHGVAAVRHHPAHHRDPGPVRSRFVYYEGEQR